MENNERGTILIRLREQKRLTQEQVADALDTDQSTISAHERGAKPIGRKWMQRYATFYGVSLDVIAGITPLPNGRRTGQRQIPVVGQVACGEPMYVAEEAGEYITLPEEILPPGEVIAIRMVGDSMERARLHDGDYALVKVQPEVEEGEIAAVCVGDDRSEATIKRFRRVDGFIMLTPDSENTRHGPLAYREDQVHVVGKVAGVWWG